MTPSQYIKQCMLTDTDAYTPSASRLHHGIMGITTEAGELMDAVKRTMYYREELDRVNIKEELGDLLWYVALLCDTLSFSFEEVMQANINKLLARYPKKFTTTDAIERDLDKEREVLEGKRRVEDTKYVCIICDNVIPMPGMLSTHPRSCRNSEALVCDDCLQNNNWYTEEPSE